VINPANNKPIASITVFQVVFIIFSYNADATAATQCELFVN